MSDLFYCSTEVIASEFPMACTVKRFLKFKNLTHKAAVIQMARPAYPEKQSTFVVVAKGVDSLTEALATGLVWVYLLPFDGRTTANELDLTAGLQPVRDWGALTTSLAEAQLWQPTAG
jgi:hypothetical protein